MAHERQCNQCGTTYTAKRSNSKYCTATCRVQYNRDKANKVDNPTQAIFEHINTITDNLFDKELGYDAHVALHAIAQYCNTIASPTKYLWWNCDNCGINVKASLPDKADTKCQCTVHGKEPAWYPLDTML